MTRPAVLAIIAEQSNYVPPVYKALSYERATANQSAATDARIIRYRPRFDSSDNQYLAIGDGYTSTYLTRWVKLDSSGSIVWSRYNTAGQGAIEKPWTIVSVFPDSTASYYYIIAVSNLSNAQGYNYLIVSKFDMSSHALQWQYRYDNLLIRGSTMGRSSPFAVYDSADNSIYVACDIQVSSTSTSYMGLTKINGSTGAVVISKTSGNGDATNYGNQNPILALEQFGNYLYVGTYIGNQLSVTKFSKTDFSRVWGKVTSGFGTFNTSTSGPAMHVDYNGTVFIAANRATVSQTLIVRVPASGARMDYLSVDRPTYAGSVTTATSTNLGLSAESIVVDNDSNIYITYGSRSLSGYTSSDTRCIIGKINWGDADWRWLKAIDVIRQDTGAVIGISDGWAIGINKNIIYVNAVCDVVDPGLTSVDNNGQWQTLQLKFDKDGKLLTNGSYVGTFVGNRRAIKIVDITRTTMVATNYVGTNSTHFATMVDTSASAVSISTTVTAESTDYVNKYN